MPGSSLPSCTLCSSGLSNTVTYTINIKILCEVPKKGSSVADPDPESGVFLPLDPDPE